MGEPSAGTVALYDLSWDPLDFLRTYELVLSSPEFFWAPGDWSNFDFGPGLGQVAWGFLPGIGTNRNGVR